jgi:hypothetical protein
MRGARRWHVLAALVQGIGAKHLVEVGCKDGVNARNILGACPDVVMVTVDPWQPAPGQAAKFTRMDDEGAETYEDWDFKAIAADYESNIYPYVNRVGHLKMTSLEAAPRVPDASTDIVFIDGARDEASVTEDIEAWLPKVRPGGVLCGGGYNQNCPGVMRAVAASFSLLDIGLADDSVWLYYVPATGAAEMEGIL